MGFAVTDEGGIPFWSAFQGFPLQTVGYPVSQRFPYRGFTTQAMQKLVLQHQPGLRGELVEPKGVFFLNTFDELHDAGFDPWLLAFRSIPPLEDTSPDSGLPWEQVVARHLAILDRDPALKAAYFAEPRWLEVFGLPMAYGDYPTMSVVRTQRAALQRWKVDTPWAKAGEVTIANGGDIAKEVGLWPAEALYPQPPP